MKRQKSYLPGQKKKALCSVCEGLIEATFEYGIYVHPDGTKVPHVLMLCCDVCKSKLAHAHQSSYLIQSAPKSKKKSAPSKNNRPPLFDRLKEGMEDLLSYVQGEKELMTTKVSTSGSFLTRERKMQRIDPPKSALA